ncbi:MAG: hypothetical protein J6Y37_10085 [Paludibacteraceae bacterium]|nr:hypothetical protein [Paludibacteraceae bacterium]
MKRIFLFLSVWCVVSVVLLSCSKTRGYDYVDLDLPSGNLWATKNVGAEDIEDDGDYYAWGEVETKAKYDLDNLKFSNKAKNFLGMLFSKYVRKQEKDMIGLNHFYDNKETLDLEDDVAHTRMGGKWRMPTNFDLKELKDNCDWTWTEVNEVRGYKVASKLDSTKYIFLPAAGFRLHAELYVGGSCGYYWTRSLEKDCSHLAYELYFDSQKVEMNVDFREGGYPIRAVCHK